MTVILIKMIIYVRDYFIIFITFILILDIDNLIRLIIRYDYNQHVWKQVII